MRIQLVVIGLLLSVWGCTDTPTDAIPDGPRLETGEAALNAAQRNWCDTRRRAGQPTPWWCGGQEGPLAPPFDAACVDHEWVGYQIEAVGCPEAPSFDGNWIVEEPHARSRSAQLRRFCRYTWQADEPGTPPDLAALPNLEGLRLERDCDVVSGHGIELPQAASDLLFSTWKSQIEMPDWSGVASFEVAPIRVAIVDGGFGGVQGPLQPGRTSLPHPVAVGSTVRAIACPDRGFGAFCGAGSPNYNAMPYYARGSRGELGGIFGTQGRYAQAVTDAVDDWLAEPLQTRPRGLILNLSLGWDSAYDVFSAQRLPGVEAYWATRYAACQGALLIAAAGNQATDADSGPLFPAAYEALPRNCGQQLGPNIYQPLVHAVGGVDGRDVPLAISRPGSLPRLVAPAAFVSVPQDTNLEFDYPTEPMSGSSMAAATASGAAAMLWSLRPNAHPDLIMQALYHTGEPLGAPAEFAINGEVPQQRKRLSVSRAFQLACPQGVAVGFCPPDDARPTLPAPIDAGQGSGLDFGAFVALAYPNPTPVAVDEEPPPQIEGLSAYFDTWSVPQPATPNCPVCGLTSDKLYGEISNTIRDYITGLPVLKYKNQFGDIIEIALDPLPLFDPFVVLLDEKLQGVAVEAAWLEIPAKIDGKAVITSSELAIQ